jgi:hypothetical protein
VAEEDENLELANFFRGLLGLPLKEEGDLVGEVDLPQGDLMMMMEEDDAEAGEEVPHVESE